MNDLDIIHYQVHELYQRFEESKLEYVLIQKRISYAKKQWNKLFRFYKTKRFFYDIIV